jgi:hypothetical protein
MASIYILFPKENPELVGSAMQHFQWTTERFQAMSGKNHLAKSARGVLQAIFMKFKKAVGVTAPPSISQFSQATPSESTLSSRDPGSTSTMETPLSKISPTPTPSVELNTNDTSAYPLPSATNDWILPTNWDFTAITPLFPMGDLIYNDLIAFPDGGEAIPQQWNPPTSTIDVDLQPGQFSGEFGQDSVWNLLNQFDQGQI